MPFPFSFADIKSVLCIGAHSDDIEIGCGGTLLRLQEEWPDLQVHWHVLSAKIDREQGIDRAAEAMQSSEHFVAGPNRGDVAVHQFEDSFFPDQYADIKRCLGSLAARLQPSLVLTHRTDDAHQDHRILGEIAHQAFRQQPVLAFEIPKYDGDLGRPNLYVGLSEAQCERKIKAIMSGFPSQKSKPWFTHDTFAALHRLRGIESHCPTGLAEAFYANKLTV